MKQSKFTEVRIVKILSEQNQGKTINEVCREHGIGQPIFYKWKSKYGGMEAHKLVQLKELEKLLSQYKKIVAAVIPQCDVEYGFYARHYRKRKKFKEFKYY